MLRASRFSELPGAVARTKSVTTSSQTLFPAWWSLIGE
jgi:hypothetical protein